MKSYPTLFHMSSITFSLKFFFLIYFRLQDGVPDTITALRDAGIKVGASFTQNPKKF